LKGFGLKSKDVSLLFDTPAYLFIVVLNWHAFSTISRENISREQVFSNIWLFAL